jgi:agmatine/peptidylarginine deiminase
MNRLILYVIMCIAIMQLQARIVIVESEPQPDHDAILPFPYHLTPAEIEYWANQPPIEIEPVFSPPLFTPPTSSVRPVAEFDQNYGVLIRYPLGIPLALVREMSNIARVVTIVANTTIRTQAINAYTGANVNMASCDFIIATTDSYWTRDYGPWYSMSPDGTLNVINFNYNRPRPNDNAFMAHYATWDTLSIYNMNITHCGGNYMTDGISIAASSHIAYTENSNNSTLVNQRMADYLGVQTYHVVSDPNGDYINHIDCWGKFLSPDTILIRSVPITHPRFAAIEQTVAYFSSQMSAWGRPYKIVRVNTPNNQPYTNSFILNNAVFVPIMNSPHDAVALQVYADAMPGYTIYGVLNNTSNPWVGTDALHCRTHELAERRIVYIDHMPISENLPYQNSIEINASVFSFTGHPIDQTTVAVNYRKNRGEFISITMTEHPYYFDDFYTNITGFVPGDTLYYYISASDTSNRSANHPFIGAPMAHKIIIDSDYIPPIIDFTPFSDLEITDFPLFVTAFVVDNIAIQNVLFEYFTNIDETIVSVEMEYQIDDIYTCLLDISLDYVSNISYRIRATDVCNPPNVATMPVDDWFTANIYSGENGPTIIHTPRVIFSSDEINIYLTASITDESSIAEAHFDYYTDIENNISKLPMLYNCDGDYFVIIDNSCERVNEIFYRLRAKNQAEPPTTAMLPLTGWFCMKRETTAETDIFSPSPQLNITVYPNPLRTTDGNLIKMNIASDRENHLNIELFNIKGQKVATHSTQLQKNQLNTIEWNIRDLNLSNGIYLVRFVEADTIGIRKILLLR